MDAGIVGTGDLRRVPVVRDGHACPQYGGREDGRFPEVALTRAEPRGPFGKAPHLIEHVQLGSGQPPTRQL
ncbi:hypothetical protein [Micromonospora sp. NPDC093277]|uniref:hypothetical protein n=1 Tax=Micromonospora sp. NPDC093277 TaxID=3364291 RepID=UPI00380DA861